MEIQIFLRDLELILQANLSIIEVCYAEIKRLHWLKLVMLLTTANQSALFQHIVVKK